MLRRWMMLGESVDGQGPEGGLGELEGCQNLVKIGWKWGLTCHCDGCFVDNVDWRSACGPQILCGSGCFVVKGAVLLMKMIRNV
jgi:hypothetical protein